MVGTVSVDDTSIIRQDDMWLVKSCRFLIRQDDVFVRYLFYISSWEPNFSLRCLSPHEIDTTLSVGYSSTKQVRVEPKLFVEKETPKF